MAMYNVSPKYKDIISKSTKITSTCPVVYQLKPKRQELGNLIRKTIGENKLNKLGLNKTVLFVGETGTGKSTLINALVNYAMGVKWEDKIWFQIVEDEKRRQSESQTSDVIVYDIFGFEGETLPYSLTIIDTPGFGDTRGIEKDDIVSQRLFQLFQSEDGVKNLNVVCLVLKASENRVSDRMMYIFDSVMSLFGRDMEKNIVNLITYSDGLPPKNAIQALETANIKCARNDKDQPLCFLFNNSQHEERTEETEFILENMNKISQRGMTMFTSFLQQAQSPNIDKTLGVLRERIRLSACIQNLQERIMYLENKQNASIENRKVVMEYEREMKENENFTIEVAEEYKVLEKIKGGWWGLGLFYEGATRCTTCEENCHYPECTMAINPNHCEIFKCDRCTSCRKNCHVSNHVKDEQKYVSKTRKVTQTVQVMKEKYELIKISTERSISLLENLEKEIKDLKEERSQWLTVAFQLLVKLDEIALNTASASTHVHLDFLIAKTKEEGDTAKVQKLEQMKKQSMEKKGIMSALRYLGLCGKQPK